ncbi:MAG TPA: hypothetical protein VF074_18480, partial [Pyrinomonadaceae bacterium]
SGSERAAILQLDRYRLEVYGEFQNPFKVFRWRSSQARKILDHSNINRTKLSEGSKRICGREVICGNVAVI